MGKKTPKAPEAPKPSASMVDEYNPYGSSVYTPIAGTDRFSKTISLDPTEQKILDAQRGLTTNLLGKADAATGARITDIKGLMDLRNAIAFGKLPQGVGNVAQGPIQTSIGDGGPIQSSLDYSSLTKLPGADDFSGDRQKVEDAMYARSTARLDPQFQQDETRLATALANKGVTEGSAAWTKAMGDFARQKEAAYAGARNDAIAAGGNEQSRIFGLSMGARQQGQNEVNTQGNFANSAQAQRFGQILDRGNFANNAQSQEFTQGMGNATLANALRAQMTDEQMKDAQLRMQTRQQQLAEFEADRTQPMRDYSMIFGQAGPAAPQFSNNVDLGALNTANYQGQLNNYNQQVNSRNSTMGNIFGLAGNIGAAYLMSDIRLKDRITKSFIVNGINVYEFSYRGDSKRYRGVMAQEVTHIPGAVKTDKHGFMAVDYSKLPVKFEEVRA